MTIPGKVCAPAPKSPRSFKVGMRVRAERDEVAYPSKGSWPRYRGKVGTVVTINRNDGEIGVVFGPPVAKRPDGRGLSYDGALVSWFLPRELIRDTSGDLRDAP